MLHAGERREDQGTGLRPQQLRQRRTPRLVGELAGGRGDGAQGHLSDRGGRVPEHVAEQGGGPGLAGEGHAEAFQGAELFGRRLARLEPGGEDRRHAGIAIGGLRQREESVLAQARVGGAEGAGGEIKDGGALGRRRHLGEDTQEAGLLARAGGGLEVIHGEDPRAQAGVERGMLEESIERSIEQGAQGRGRGGRADLAETHLLAGAAGHGGIRGAEVAGDVVIGERAVGGRLGRGERHRLDGTHAVDPAGDVGGIEQAGRAVRVPGAGIENEQGTIRGLDDVGEMGARLGEREKIVFGGAVAGAFLLEFKTDDLLRVVERHHEVEVVGGGGEGRGEFGTAGPEGAAAGHQVAEVGDERHLQVRAELVGDDVQEVGARVDAAELPLADRVVPRDAVVEVAGAEELAGRGDGQAGRVIAADQGMPADVGAIGAHRPDAAGQALVHERAVRLLHVMTLAAMRPVKAAIRVSPRTVDVGAVGRPLETAHQQLALVGHAVAVGVRELPDAGRRGHVERAVQPAGALRHRQAVGEDRAAIEDAVAVAILQHHDAAGLLGLVPRRAPGRPRGIAHEETTLRVHAAQGRVRDHPGGGGLDQLEAGGHAGLGGRADALPFRQHHLGRAGQVGRQVLRARRRGGRGGGGLLRRGCRRPLLRELTQRVELVAAHEHLGRLGLQQDATAARLAVERAVHQHAVGEILQGIALRDDLEARPLAEGRLDVGAATVALHVLPVHVAVLPVETAAGHGNARGARRPDGLLVAVLAELGADGDRERDPVRGPGAEDEDVAHAAFDDLGLDAGHPRPALGADRPEAMDEDAVVAGTLGAAAPGLLAPLELADEVVILVGALGHHGAIALAAHAEGAIRLQLVDFLGVAVDVGLRVDVIIHLPVAHVLEQVDDLRDRLLGRLGRQRGRRLGGRRLRPRGERAEQGRHERQPAGWWGGSHGGRRTTRQSPGMFQPVSACYQES